MPIDNNPQIDQGDGGGGSNSSSNLTNINIYKISRSDYNTLWNNGARNGHITVAGQPYDFEDDAIYLIKDRVNFTGTTVYTSAANDNTEFYTLPEDSFVRYSYLVASSWDNTNKILALSTVTSSAKSYYSSAHTHTYTAASSSGDLDYTDVGT